MRLSQYPYVVVRLACTKCSRKGQYRLARLADKYGSECELSALRVMMSADCKLAEKGRPGIDVCGCHFPDLSDGPTRPPDDGAPLKRPRLKLVG